MKKLGFILVLACSFFTCTKEEISSRPFPRVNTNDVQDITAQGAVAHGEITFTNVPVTDHGFIWSASPSMTITSGNRMSLGPASGPQGFSAKIEDNLEVNRTYYVIAYAKSADYTVYGQTKSFVSLGGKAPVLSQVTPASATWGDTIKLVGKNFNKTVATNQVYFDALAAKVLRGRADTLVCVVPTDLDKSPVTVKVSNLGNVGLLENIFSLKSPVITKIDPALGSVGTKVTITGKYLHPKYIGVKFNNITAKVISASATQVVVEVPEGLSEGAVPLKVNTLETLTTETTFQYKDPEITSYSPTIVKFGDVVTIKGNYLPTQVSNIEIYLDNVKTQVISATGTETQFIVPNTLKSSECTLRYKFKNIDITLPQKLKMTAPSVTSTAWAMNNRISISGNNFAPSNSEVYIGGVKGKIISITTEEIIAEYLKGVSHTMSVKVVSLGLSSNTDVNVRLAWLKRAAIPTAPNWVMMIAGAPYGIAESSGETFRYNATDDLWEPVATGPSLSRTGFCFSIGQFGYIGGGEGNRSFWKYDASKDTWSAIDDLPFTKCSAYAFSMNGKGYAMGGGEECWDPSQQDVWRFDPTNNSWTRLHDAPSSFWGTMDLAYTESKIYVRGPYDDVMEYTPLTDSWKGTPVYIDPNNQKHLMYSLNGGLVAYNYSYNYVTKLHFFDFATEEWTSFEKYLPDNYPVFKTFIYNDYGASIDANGALWTFDAFELK